MKYSNPLLTFNVTFLTLCFFVYVLYIGSSIIVPFVVAVLFSFIILSIASFYRHYGLHKYLSLLASLFTIAVVMYGIGKVLDANIQEIITSAPAYQEKLISIFDSYAQKYSIDSTIVREQILWNLDITLIVSSTASAITAIVKNAGIIFFFTLFILLESTSFRSKLSLITGGDKSTFFRVFGQVQDDMKSYFKIKTITSIWVSIMSAIIMFFFWLDFFIFWAFIIFLLNYIPSVWSIIAVSFPVIFSLIQFESLYITTIFLILMVAIQVLVWNIIEPRLMWNKLNLSPLVIIISLIFWGTIWGPIGMLLSVPIMVMVNIVLAHIELTRPIAILLSEKWVVKFTQPWKWMKTTLSLKKMRKLLKK